MTLAAVLIVLGLLGVSPSEMEQAGSLPEAGLAWQIEGNAAGQARVVCRLLEEALYAGHGVRAFLLIDALGELGAEPSQIDFWFARLAWITGLETMAIEELESFTGDDWLSLRARGMAHTLSRRPEDALPLLERSMQAAGTTRRRFYSAVDLCWAELACGNSIRATQMATFLMDSFPHDGLPGVLLALCYHRSGQFASAMVLLQQISQNQSLGAGPRSMAADLLEDFE